MHPLNSELSERRRNTRRKVFNYIFRSEEGCSKKDISNDLQLSMPTVYQDVDELLSAGLICYDGQRQSSGGRPSKVLTVVKTARTAVGIGISAGKLNFISTDLSGEVIGHKEVRHRYEVEDPYFPFLVADELEHFLDELEIDRKSLLGVGISIPGIVDLKTETILFAPTLRLKNYSYALLKEKIPYPVHVDNDANSGVFAEWYGGRKDRSIAYLSLEAGVGGAVVVNGKMFGGNNNRSGEFGHMCVEPNGLPCACGKKGCLEAYCSPLRISRELGVSPAVFFKGLEEEVHGYLSFWNDYKKHLAIGIHNMKMMLDGDVVLGGGLSEYLKPRLGEIRAEAAQHDPFNAEMDYISISRTTRYSALLGAALHFIHEFLEDA